MNNRNSSALMSVLLPILALVVLALPSVGATPSANTQRQDAGFVYIMTNSASGNQIIAYNRASDGLLTLAGTFSTNGLGTGGSLGNQGGLALSRDGRWLFAVNAGSNSISVFRVTDDGGLKLVETQNSEGSLPISVTLNENIVYVLNNATNNQPGNIAGFYLADNGDLFPIPGSVQPLSGKPAATAQISFNPSGTILTVTEKTTNLIDMYTVNERGVASAPIVIASNGAEPFGFVYDDRAQLIVSEAMSGALSSYRASHSGYLTTVSASIPDGGVAPCWVVITRDNAHDIVFTTNTHSSTVSSYSVGEYGRLTLLQSVAANTGAGPIDEALSAHSDFLYVSESGAQQIQAFSVNADGTLNLLQTVSGLPVGADGLAAS